jgi:hypothetical protein
MLTAMLVAMLGSNIAAAASPAPCDMWLTVELWPDAPDCRYITRPAIANERLKR